MRANLYNSENPALITKKFWSHKKSFSKSHRLPKCMHLNDTYKDSPEDKAELLKIISMNNALLPLGMILTLIGAMISYLT